MSWDNSWLADALRSTQFYGKPLLFLYAYLLIAGFILSWNFRSKLTRLVKGAIEARGFRGTALYGLHLTVLYPYLYALLAYSIILVWDFALVSFWVVSNLGRIPIILIIVLVIVVIGSFWAILKGFFGSKKRNVFGIQLKREAQPQIWQLCDKVAREVETKTVDEIFLSPQPGIGVHLSGGLFSMLFGRTKRTLTIGMPSISALSISEMEAILAHEYGHFSNKDTAWNSLTFTMAAALHNALLAMPSPWNAGGSIWMIVTSALNPALWVLKGYELLFSVVTAGFSRMREVFADRTAIALYGQQNFCDGLLKVARNDHIFVSYFHPEMLRMLTEEKKMYVNVFDSMAQTLVFNDAARLADINKSIISNEHRSTFDSHPLLKDRLSYARYFEVEAKYATENDYFKGLFVDWNDVSQNMSDLYTQYVALLAGYGLKNSKHKVEEGDGA